MNCLISDAMSLAALIDGANAVVVAAATTRVADLLPHRVGTVISHPGAVNEARTGAAENCRPDPGENEDAGKTWITPAGPGGRVFMIVYGTE